MLLVLRFLYALVMLALVSVLPVLAGEVQIPMGAYTANADWETTPGGADKPVVLLVHGTMGHKDMEIIQQAQDLLLENGYDSLAINLTLNRDNRHGFMPCDVPQTHLHEDAAQEIAAWSDWLKKQGRHQIILMGHSRGGLQVAQYQAGQHDPAVVAMALLAPMANRAGGESNIKSVHGQNDASRAFLHCAAASQVAPSTRASYQRNGAVSLLDALAAIRVPVDVFVGSEDTSAGVIRLQEISADTRLKHVRGHEIDGADHFFRDLYLDEVVDILLENWQKLNPDSLAIQAVLSRQQQAWNQGDLDAFMQGYENSEQLRFASGDHITYGWRNTLNRYKKRYGPGGQSAGMGQLRFRILELRQPAADFAIVFGRWQLDYGDKNPSSPRGLFTLFWKKSQGQWRIVADHTSSAH